MSEALPVDAVGLRDEVRAKYRDVAVNPHGAFHFHTGRPLARRLGYDEDVVARMPESAIEAFAGVGNPFSQGALNPGERVVDLGSKPLTWRRLAKTKLEAAAGAASSSERSWSITARHSTRTAEIGGVWNVCAETGAAPAGAREVATSRRKTSLTAFPVTASPLGAKYPRRAA